MVFVPFVRDPLGVHILSDGGDSLNSIAIQRAVSFSLVAIDGRHQLVRGSYGCLATFVYAGT